MGTNVSLHYTHKIPVGWQSSLITRYVTCDFKRSQLTEYIAFSVICSFKSLENFAFCYLSVFEMGNVLTVNVTKHLFCLYM